MKREALTIAVAMAIAVVAGSLLIWFVGKSPLHVYGLLLSRTWGTSNGIGQVLFKATPLIFTGLAVSVAFKVGLFNIGAEGQLAAGAFVTALVGAALPAALPALVAVPLCILSGMAAGAGVSGLAGWLKVRYGAHEVINTIMLNFVVSSVTLWLGNALFFVKYTVHTSTIPDSATLPRLGFSGSEANTSLLLALGCAGAIWYFFDRTRRGFEWRAVGHNPRAAENAGVRIGRVFIGAMAIGGAMAGAVGANYVLGYKHYYERGMGSGFGVIGIAVALLGRNHPAGIVAAALLFGTLLHGSLVVAEEVPKEIFQILQAVIILAVACASVYLRRRAAARGATT